MPSTLTAGRPDHAIPPRFPDGRAGKASCHVRRYIITLDQAPPRPVGPAIPWLAGRLIGRRLLLPLAEQVYETILSRVHPRFCRSSLLLLLVLRTRTRATRRGAFGNFPVPRSLAANDPFIIHIRVRRGCQRRGDERFSRGRE